jgi:hypothetical protein
MKDRGIDNAHGIFEPFAALILQSQGEAGSSPRFKPRLPFDERPPRSIFVGGSVAQICNVL